MSQHSLTDQIRNVIIENLKKWENSDFLDLLEEEKNKENYNDTLILYFKHPAKELLQLQQLQTPQLCKKFLLESYHRIRVLPRKEITENLEKKKELSEFLVSVTLHDSPNWICDIEISIFLILIIVEENKENVNMCQAILIPTFETKKKNRKVFDFQELHGLFAIPKIVELFFPKQVELSYEFTRELFYPYTLDKVKETVTKLQADIVSDILNKYCYCCKKKFPKIYRCGNCKFMKYCSKTCQSLDAGTHKMACGTFRTTLVPIKEKQVATKDLITKKK